LIDNNELSGPSGSPFRAVLFDAGNTLVFLDYSRIAAGLSRALGLPVTEEELAAHADDASRAMELAAGTDQERAVVYLETLVLAAGIPGERMDEVRDCLAQMHRERHLWSAVPSRTHEALARLRAAGFRLGVVSNSDGRADEALRAAGLRQYFDVVVDSSVVGLEKPDPRIFHAALDQLGAAASETLYVGDLYEVDVAGARAAGIEAVLLADKDPKPGRSCRTTSSIDALVNAMLSRETPVAPKLETR
jgi:HAD superfamily hydrolase (TIGR01509 family)